MRVSEIVGRLSEPCRSRIHVRRMRTLLEVIDALVEGGRLTGTALGRALPGPVADKHQIKRVDRLLGNVHLAHERMLLMRAVAHRLLEGVHRPVLAVDWTQLTGRWWALVATLVFDGRSLPLFAQVHPESEFGSRKAHRRFLQELRWILPTDCQPVIVADAQFKTPFFQACTEVAVDYVVRLRGHGYVEAWCPDARLSFEQLFAQAGPRARCIGRVGVYATRRESIRRVVLGPKPASRSIKSNDGNYETRALQPLLLTTSLEQLDPDQVVRIYQTRMQIEETFRDAKNPRFGWALRFTMSRHRSRLANLLLIAALALVAVTLVGIHAEQQQMHRRYQANTERKRRVLSLVHLGQLVVRKEHRRIRWLHILYALSNLASFADALAPTLRPPEPPVMGVLPDCPFCVRCVQLCFDFY